MKASRVQGRVAWFNRELGYGFVATTAAASLGIPGDVYLSAKVVSELGKNFRLEKGDLVEFSLFQYPSMKWVARNLHLLFVAS